MATISNLPPEILLHIFRFYLETEEQSNLIRILAEVCLEWKNICLNKYLWSKYDGTPSFKEMKFLCESGCLSNTKEFIMSQVDNQTMKNEENIFSALQNVEIISFSRVKQLSTSTLTAVAEKCSKLREIHFANSNKNPLKLSFRLLENFFVFRGCGLVKIDISYCQISNFPLTIRCISDNCPNLEYLNLINFGYVGIFPTKYFQSHCQNLKVLHLDQSTALSSDSYTFGFPNLEVFTYHCRYDSSISDKEFKCVLFNSTKIKFLNLTNCNISADALCSLPACSVEYLYLSRSKVCNTNALSDVLKKWSHSLKEVDISYGGNGVNKGVFNLVTTSIQSPLEYLNLKYTKIIPDMIKEVLKNCTHLETLELEGCRSLNRGMKRTYSGTNEFRNLFKKLKVFKSDYPGYF